MSKAHLVFPKTFSHSISIEGDYSFSPIEFSLFKHGRDDLAKSFANDLYRSFIEQHTTRIRNRRVIVYSSPYDIIPTSSLLLTRHFMDRLREAQSDLRIQELILGKINRCQTYAEDYSNLTFEERFDLIRNDTYRFDVLPAPDDLLIFIDDITITGSHQLVLERLIAEHNLENDAIFHYFAALTLEEINPRIEAKLNDHYVNSVERLAVVVLHPDCRLVTRTIKRILRLGQQDFNTFIEALGGQARVILTDIFHSAIRNKYNEKKEYNTNLFFIHEYISSEN